MQHAQRQPCQSDVNTSPTHGARVPATATEGPCSATRLDHAFRSSRVYRRGQSQSDRPSGDPGALTPRQAGIFVGVVLGLAVMFSIFAVIRNSRLRRRLHSQKHGQKMRGTGSSASGSESYRHSQDAPRNPGDGSPSRPVPSKPIASRSNTSRENPSRQEPSDSNPPRPGPSGPPPPAGGLPRSPIAPVASGRDDEQGGKHRASKDPKHIKPRGKSPDHRQRTYQQAFKYEGQVVLVRKHRRKKKWMPDTVRSPLPPYGPHRRSHSRSRLFVVQHVPRDAPRILVTNTEPQVAHPPATAARVVFVAPSDAQPNRSNARTPYRRPTVDNVESRAPEQGQGRRLPGNNRIT